MNCFLVDTSGYSALRKGHPGIAEEIRKADRLCLTVVVLGELRAGFSMGSHRRTNEDLLALFLASPRVEVLILDKETSERYAVILCALRAIGTPVPTNDIWIAATAMQHGLPVLTTDVHFQRIPQILVRHFEN